MSIALKVKKQAESCNKQGALDGAQIYASEFARKEKRKDNILTISFKDKSELVINFNNKTIEVNNE